MRLCHLDDLPDGSARGFDPHASGRDSLFVVRCGPVLRAWVNACPHHGTPLAWRKGVSNQCPAPNTVVACTRVVY